MTNENRVLTETVEEEGELASTGRLIHWRVNAMLASHNLSYP